MLTTIKKDELSLMIENCVRKVVRESIGQKSSPEPEYLIGIKEAARKYLDYPSRGFTRYAPLKRYRISKEEIGYTSLVRNYWNG